MVRAISNELAISIWEQAYNLRPACKSVVLLGLAVPDRSLAELRSFSIGKRDAALLDLRARLFGQPISCITTCPECNEKVELTFCVDDIRVADADDMGEPRHEFSVTAEGRELRARALTCDDLLAVDHLPTPAERRNELVRRCIRFDDSEVDPTDLVPAQVDAVSSRLADYEPQADVVFPIDCPKCEHHWKSRFDIVTFLWHELDAWAQRLLAEVHALASAYGWSERDILGMSTWRRQVYLEMLRQ